MPQILVKRRNSETFTNLLKNLAQDVNLELDLKNIFIFHNFSAI